MKNRIKFCLALSALMAFGAIVTSSASAAAGEWDFAWEHVTPTVSLKGDQAGTNVFTVPAGTVKCTSVTFSGSATGTTAETVPSKTIDYAKHEITVTPSFSGCTAFGQAAEVTTNGCTFTFTATSTTGGKLTAITCTFSAITIMLKISGCTVTVPSQTPGTPTVDFTESGTGASRDILARATIGGIKATSSGGACGAKGETSTGTYTGTVTFKGFNGTTQIGIGLAETVS